MCDCGETSRYGKMLHPVLSIKIIKFGQGNLSGGQGKVRELFFRILVEPFYSSTGRSFVNMLHVLQLKYNGYLYIYIYILR